MTDLGVAEWVEPKGRAAQAHCVRGHLLDGDNIEWDILGPYRSARTGRLMANAWRRCLLCKEEYRPASSSSGSR